MRLLRQRNHNHTPQQALSTGAGLVCAKRRTQTWLTIALLACCWLPLSTPTSFAQTPASLLSGALGKISGDGNAVKATDTEPDLAQLKAGWWNYFIDPDSVETRVDQFLSRLTERAKQVPDEEVAKALGQQLNLIEASAKGYVTVLLSEPSVQTGLEERVHQPAYTPSELINLYNEVRSLKQRQAQIAVEIDNGQQELTTINTRLDNRFASYLQTTQQDSAHLLAAYEIIADRFSLMLAAVRADMRKQSLALIEDVIYWREQEVNFAKANLVSSIKAVSQSGQQIKRLTAELDVAREATLQARAEASTANDATLVEQAHAKFLEQKIINAELTEVLLATQLLRWNAERILLSLINAGIDPQQARTMLAEQQTKSTELRNRTERLRTATNAESDLVYRAGATLGLNNEQRAEEQSSDESAALQAETDARIRQVQAAQVLLSEVEPVFANFDQLLSLSQSKIFQQEGTLRNVGGKTQLFFSKAWAWLKASTNKSLFRLGDTPVTPKGILIALSVILAGWLLSWALRRFLYSLADEGDYSHSVYYTIGRLAHYALILLSILLGISLLGISLTSFAVVAGALAIGIGFGLQAIVSNFISGLILLFERSLKVGDFIEFTNTGLQGEVKAINVRSTQIKTNDNIDIVVPNSEFMNTKVVNWTLHEPYRRMIYDFRVGFDADKKQVREAIMKAASALPYTMTGIPGKGPQVWLVGYGEFAYNMQLAVWLKPSAVKRPQAVNAAYFWAIDNALEEIGVSVPVPQREIVIKHQHINGEDNGEDTETTASDHASNASNESLLNKLITDDKLNPSS